MLEGRGWMRQSCSLCMDLLTMHTGLRRTGLQFTQLQLQMGLNSQLLLIEHR